MTSTVKDLDVWRAQALEALGAVEGMSFQPQPGGETFTVPHPLLLTDEQNKALDDASGALAIASVLLGDPLNYSRFVMDGGRAGDVMMAWRIMQQNVELDPNSLMFMHSSAGVHHSSSLTSSTVIPASTAPSINGGELSSPVAAS